MARVIGRGDGERRYSARGSVMLFKAVADLDDGDLSLMERTLPPHGRRPPPHRHTNCSEAYFVLDGRVAVTVDGEDLDVGPEGFVLVPRGTRTPSATPVTTRLGCWSCTHPRWTPTSPSCTSCGTGTSRRHRTRNGR